MVIRSGLGAETRQTHKFATRPKGYVNLSRTVNLGAFNSIKLEFGTEFYLDESSHTTELAKLDYTLKDEIKKMGLVVRHD